MNPPPIQWIPVFEASARFQNFRKAATHLNISPPAVSQHIKALENYLDVELFKRNGPRLTLTKAGEFYYRSAKEIVAVHKHSFQELDRRFNKRSLRLHAPLFITQEMLIPNYLGYKSLQPKAELRITTGTEYIDFDSGIADAAIRFGTGDWSPLESKLLCKIQTSPICSPDYFKRQWENSNLSLHRIVANQVLISINEDLVEWKQLFPDLVPKDAIICDSYFSLINAVEQGLGIGLGIFPAINIRVNDNRLRLIRNELFETNSAYWLVYPRQKEENELLGSCYLWSSELFKKLPALSL